MLPINALVQPKGNQTQAIFALFWRAGGRARVRAGVREEYSLKELLERTEVCLA